MVAVHREAMNMMDVCAFCRLPIPPAANKITVNAMAYHADCWDRKGRATK